MEHCGIGLVCARDNPNDLDLFFFSLSSLYTLSPLDILPTPPLRPPESRDS